MCHIVMFRPAMDSMHNSGPVRLNGAGFSEINGRIRGPGGIFFSGSNNICGAWQQTPSHSGPQF